MLSFCDFNSLLISFSAFLLASEEFETLTRAQLFLLINGKIQ